MREIVSRAQLGDRHIHRARAGVEIPMPVSVATTHCPSAEIPTTSLDATALGHPPKPWRHGL